MSPFTPFRGPVRRVCLGGIALAAALPITVPAAAVGEETVLPVTLHALGSGYELRRGGEPYYIKGAGVGDADKVAALAAAGGNSVRTWGTEQTEEIIDVAHAHGLTVLAGLWIEHERHGFDYDDEAAVAAQIAAHCAAVDRFKDHPAILMWGVGNEVSINAQNPRVWDVIEAVAAHIQKVDPRRPVMTVLPHVSAEEVRLIRERCPSIDVLGFNTYGGIDAIGRHARAYGWNGPYVIAEWGPDGNWEAETTPWGAEIEPTTTEKAMLRGIRYARILEDPRCLGSYTFFWGQKQETTPTWFNLFLENGAAVEGVEVMQYLWTGSFPEERAPALTPLRINGASAEDGLVFAPGEAVEADFAVWRTDLDEATVRWELLPESRHKGQGGDFEARPEPVPLRMDRKHPTHLEFDAPAKPGAYRLFVYVETPAGRAASANFPFQVAPSKEE